MPSARAFLRAPGAFVLALARILRTVVVVGFGAFALALLALRFFVLPHIESYRDTLASMLTKELGHPVEIATLTTDWDGWNPKLLVKGFRVLESASSDALPLVDLPEVALVVSWTSVPLFALRLKELAIERPRLAIRRNRAGHLQVGGMEFDPARAEGESALADWILQQREIVVRDALITWDDDLRNAPQLVLDRVQFKLENSFGRLRFGLKGMPPAGLAAPIDVRGDVRDTTVRDWQRGEGRMFVRLDYADVGAWREWLPLPQQILGGKGAMRVWFQFADGKPREVIADLELRDVSAKMGDDLPELDLVHLSGRAGWRATNVGREFFTQALAFTTEQGGQLDPTNFKLTLRDDASRSAGQMEFDRLQLEPLAAIAANLPLATGIRGDLARFAPRGTLVDGRLRWEGAAESPSSYAANAEFRDLGVTAQDDLPGITGISGRFNIAHDRGEIRLTGNGSVLALPRVFEAPISFSSLQSVAKWERREGRTSVRVEQFEFANADAAGSASGTYRTTGQGPGEIDITAQVSRVDARHVYAYLPRVIDDPTRRWLRTSLTAGAGSDARLKLAGNLAQFPFVNGKGGQFVVTAKARGVTLSYAPSWPAIEAIDADLRFEGTRMKIDATRGRAFGVDIGKARAEIADVIADHPLLTIEGEADGPVEGFLRYVNESPVVGWLELPGRAGDAAGNGRLALKLALPLRELEHDSKAVGEFTLSDAQMRIGTLPMLTRINGKVAFSEREVRARELTMETLGGPAKVDISTSDGRARITAAGSLSIAALRREQPSEFLDKIAGSTDWSVAASLRQATLAWTLQSSMKGASVDLPPPLGKTAAETMPLRIERRDDATQAGTDFIIASYGGIAQLAAHRKVDVKGITVDRALLSLGKAIERSDADRAERPGLWVRAELPALNVDDWITVLRREKGPASTERNQPLPEFAGADLDVGQFEALGVKFTDLNVAMRETASRWSFVLSGREIAGTANWSTPDAGMPNGRLVARLSRLAIPGRAGASAWRSASNRDDATDAKADLGAGNPWPEIDVVSDSLVSKERNLGHLELLARPRGSEWRIDRLVLANDNGRLEAEGAWRVLDRAQQTKLDIILDVKEAGGFLATFGYPDSVQGAPTKIDGQLVWAGAPHEFDFPTLSGTFHIGVGAGRFTRIEPGLGKLIGVLSLQALPRRVSLDFRDVFSEGFAFDEINGNVRITNGVMATSNLKLAGPAAKVEISGETDLAKETQRLSVRVQPALSSSVSAGAALLFLANPIVGAVVGAGSLLAQTIMHDPIEKIFSYEYAVSGSWSDPIVTRNASATASAPPQLPGQPSMGVTR